MVREIPPLRILCLRRVGAHECNAEKTFAPIVSSSSTSSTKTQEDGNAPTEKTTPPSRKGGRKSPNNNNRGKKGRQEQQNNQHQEEKISTALQLLQSFHHRPPVSPNYHNNNTNDEKDIHDNATTLNEIPMTRMALVGPNASKRSHANDVDINCPFVACRYTNETLNENKNDNDKEQQQQQQSLLEGEDPYNPVGDNIESQELVVQYGNCALDCLQSYIDALTEQGRMDDTRLGKHFFQTWRQACLGIASSTDDNPSDENEEDENENDQDNRSKTPPPGRKKRKRGGVSPTPRTTRATTPPPLSSTAETSTTKKPSSATKDNHQNQQKLGSLSLHNCAIAERTINAMLDAKIGQHLAVLDVTGMQNMGDALLGRLLAKCSQLQRLSIKNCRRLSPKFLKKIVKHCASTLEVLDVGGCVNMPPDTIIDAVENLPNLLDLNASGLGWTNEDMHSLCEAKDNWKGLGLGFSFATTSEGFRTALSMTGHSLTRLAIPFCEGAVDNALLGYLGKALPHVAVLDIRGNGNVNSLTAWFDGRAAARISSKRTRTTVDGDGNYNDQEERHDTSSHPSSNSSEVEEELFVLARYSGINNNSIEETKRIHPLYASKFVCILDGEGSGGGIRR